jgi:2-hydroxychromene-2-carboxylate isomerase
MAKTVEFFFDFGSPAAYLAYTQLPSIAARTGAELVWRPFLLGGVFKATGNTSPVMVPAKGAYFGKDMGRYAARYGVALNMPPNFPVNTLGFMRAAAGLEGTEMFRPFVDAIYRAMFVEGRAMGDPAVAAAALNEAGLDAGAIMAKAEDPAAKERLKTTPEEAVARGAFGAPTMYVGQEMFFGQDRLDWVEAALKA